MSATLDDYNYDSLAKIPVATRQPKTRETYGPPKYYVYVKPERTVFGYSEEAAGAAGRASIGAIVGRQIAAPQKYYGSTKQPETMLNRFSAVAGWWASLALQLIAPTSRTIVQAASKAPLGSIIPSTVVQSALVFISYAQIMNVPIPTSLLEDDQEVVFRWKAAGFSASACIMPDGHVVAYAKNEDRSLPLLKIDAPASSRSDLSSLFARIIRFA
jgi:hypothetical protein